MVPSIGSNAPPGPAHPASVCHKPCSPAGSSAVAKVPVTVVIPTLNEAFRIEQALARLAWADEVIVADGGSHDGTVELAEQIGAKVLRLPGATIAAQRNAGNAEAGNRWILALDVDERVSSELSTEIGEVLHAPTHEAYRIPFRNFYLEHELRHGRWGNEAHVRLFQKNRRFIERRVHEDLEPVGDIGLLRGTIEHRPYLSLAHHMEKMIRYSRWAAQDLAERGRQTRLGDLAFRPLWRFVREYAIAGGWRDGRAGLLAAAMSGVAALLKYAHLQELEWSQGTAADLLAAELRSAQLVPAPPASPLPKARLLSTGS